MRTAAIIHLDRFERNLNALKTYMGNPAVRICVPVKADAYGHGAPEIAKTAVSAGVYCLGVATLTEALELKNEGVKAPILLLSQPHPQEIPAIADAGLIPVISDTWFAAELGKQAVVSKIKLPVHIKIDTGMGRLGCRIEEALSLAKFVTQCAGLELAGVSTHFAAADSTSAQDIAYTQAQIEKFKEALGAIQDAGIDTGIVHAANSGAVLLHPNTWFDMVRPGIFLYGYKTTKNQENQLVPEPVMELKSTVTAIKKVKKGESVSYGRTWTAVQDTHIGIISAGYADGIPRLASGKWQVAAGGKSYPIVGRITMDQSCVNLGIEPQVKRWDEVVIFGSNCAADTVMDAAALAQIVGTIPYEITCNVSKRVPRFYTDSKR